MLFQQVNKNTPERIWMVCKNEDLNNEDLIEGNLVVWSTLDISAIGKELGGLVVSKMLQAVTPKYGPAGVVRKGSKPVRFGEFGIIQVYGFYDGVLTDGAAIPNDTIVGPSLTTSGAIQLLAPSATNHPFVVGVCLISSADYLALGLGNKAGIFLKCM